MDSKRPLPRDIIKLSKGKGKEKIFKSARENKYFIYQEAPLRL